MITNIKFNKFILEKNRTFQDGYDEDDYDYDDDIYSSKYSDEDITDEEEDQNLEYLIRSFLSARNIKSYVDYKNDQVIIYIFLNKKEKISNLTKIFDIVTNHLAKDIFGITDEKHLSDIETELYESKEGEHIFSFTFFLDADSLDGDEEDLPF